MQYWEQKFRIFFSNEGNKNYAHFIFSSLLFGQYRGKKGHEPVIRRILEKSYSTDFFQIFDDFIKSVEKKQQYSASIFPTLISPDEGRNFFLQKEKLPDREEVFYYLYLISTGIYYGNFTINLFTSYPDEWELFMDKLKSEKQFIIGYNKKDNIEKIEGLRLDNISKYLYIAEIFKIPYNARHILIFSIINFFIVWWLKENKKIKVNSLEEIPGILKENGLDGTATLILFMFGKQKKQLLLYPRLNQFINKWYSQYLITGDRANLFLPKFIFSFLNYDKQFRDLSINYLDKFVYYLLRGKVNGELLDKLINLKIDFGVKKDIFYPIQNAQQFYANFT